MVLHSQRHQRRGGGNRRVSQYRKKPERGITKLTPKDWSEWWRTRSERDQLKRRNQRNTVV